MEILNIFKYFCGGVAFSFYSLSLISFYVVNDFIYGVFITLKFFFYIIKLCFNGVVISIENCVKGIMFISDGLYGLEKKFFKLFIPKKKESIIKNAKTIIDPNKNLVAKDNKISSNVKEVKKEELTKEQIKKEENHQKEIKQKIEKAKKEAKAKKEKEKLPFKERIKQMVNNLSVVKDYKNKQEMKRQILMIEFDPDATKKSEKKQTYQYEAKSPDGTFVKGRFDAFSKVDVHSFLLNEGYEVYDIKTTPMLNFLYGKSAVNGVKYNTKDLIFFLTQLSTYIRSGISLVDSIRIFSKQEKKESKKKILQSIIYELIMGESFSNALEKQGKTFPKLLVNMIKTAEMTGELPDTLDDMAGYYESSEKTRKQFISAMTYPTIIFIMAIGIVVFIMLFVIPEFVGIYKDVGADLPGITKFVIGASDFLSKKWPIVLIITVLVIVILIYLYKKVKLFRTMVQYILMKTPVIGKVIIYNEITLFTKTFSSLINHNVFITDSMEILSKITDNEIYKMIVFDTITNLAKGESISKSFKNHWAFPVVAYEMLLTGERTGELGVMMEKVANFYQEQHSNLVTQLKAFIEPIMISLLAFVVGGILLAVVIPMFSLYSQLGGIYDFTIWNNILCIWDNIRFIL